MAWEVEKGPQGTVWQGQDSIYNMGKMHHDKAGTGGWGCAASMGVGALVLLAMMGSKCSADFNDKEINNWPLLVVLILVAIAGIAWLAHWSALEEWIRRPWRLTANAESVEFQGATVWALPVDEIASVEASQTTAWQKVREYGAETLAIPDVEWQTFLVLTDQTRRVIYTANADREGCGALAASIRAHVEAARGASAPAPSNPAAPAGDGFDL